ncbi:MAG: hypothetical protein ACFBSE_20025 [Prochloraceae cyanobacterium]
MNNEQRTYLTIKTKQNNRSSRARVKLILGRLDRTPVRIGG